MMGTLADAVQAQGGAVTGVIPRTLLQRELAHPGIEDLRVVDSMHERKALMAELADAFLALPGGYGTLDELFEIVTWAQLGLHAKSIGLLNTAGFFTPLLNWIDAAIAHGFIPSRQGRLLQVGADPAELLKRLMQSGPEA